MIDWVKANWRKLSVLLIVSVLVYITSSPYHNSPEAKGVEFFLKGLAAAIGAGV